MIPYGRQSIDEADIAAVVDVLRGDWLTQGPMIGRFEKALADHVGASFAVAFSSGTAALHGAMAVAEVGPESTVVTSPLTFIASANCGRYLGAQVVLSDIDPDTLLLDPTNLPVCDVLVAVHYAGLPIDLGALPQRPRVVIEDAAHALGAKTPAGSIGSCSASDMCVFSFHPVKHITTGEGGVVTTNSEQWAEGLRRFRSHGSITRPDKGGWCYEVVDTGYNYRLTDIQAALGVSQLAKLDGFVKRRQELATRYRECLRELPIVLPPEAPPGFEHAYHLFPVRVGNRRRVYARLRGRGIGVQVHYIPIYRHPLYAHLGPPERYPHTELAYAGLLSLPLFPALTDEEQDIVVAELTGALS